MVLSLPAVLECATAYLREEAASSSDWEEPGGVCE